MTCTIVLAEEEVNPFSAGPMEKESAQNQRLA
jgi:hypothetical protein